MPLPRCVRIDERELASRDALLEEGWREVGVLDHYAGRGEGYDRGAKLGPVPTHMILNVEAFNFTGRLWRDPEIPRSSAIEETRNFMRSRQAFIQGDGFGIFRRKGNALIIDLIGCMTPGKATDIISTAAAYHETTAIEAGTYSDNIAARALYTSIGMKRMYSSRVFHK